MAIDATEAIGVYRTKLQDIAHYLDLDFKRARHKELETMASDPDLWSDPARGQAVSREISAVQDDIRIFDNFSERLDDLSMLQLMGEEENDQETLEEVQSGLAMLDQDFKDLGLRVLLNGDYDDNDAIVTIHAGAGGTDSQDWAEMLSRMIRRWVDTRKEFSLVEYDMQYADDFGIRSATFGITGPRAYGWLQSEHGVHRLVRISPFDSQSRRHTSFASIDVVPDIGEGQSEIEINDDDIRIDVFRASGPGGQGVNTTDSAVRITHFPSGIVVSCQNERSQLQNKETAMRMLTSKLMLLEIEKRAAELASVRGEQSDNGWGSQIRTYVMHPYQMVKDLRTNYETGNTQAVLDGALDPFMSAWLEWNAAGSTTEQS